MLLEFKTMTEEEARRLTREVYSEACESNARYFHPELEDLTEAIKEQEEYHVTFLFDRFMGKEENRYYVLEEDGQWLSALRLTKVEDFYYLEALETSPTQRKKGYGARVLMETIELLKSRGPVLIRDNVKKDNWASLNTHKKCGFGIEHDPAINFLTGETRPDCYGLFYYWDEK